MEFTTKEIMILKNAIIEIGENLKFNPLSGREGLENEKIVMNQDKRNIYELFLIFKQIEKSREERYKINTDYLLIENERGKKD